MLGLLAACASADELTWQGCAISKKGFMEACAAAYEAQTGTHMQLTAGTAELGIEATASGAADLGGTSRYLLSGSGELSGELKLAIVAWDALVVVVHPGNPIEDISRQNLIRVYQHKITNWNTLGGLAAPLLLVDRQGPDSANLSFRQLICGDENYSLTPGRVRLPTSSQVEELVERQPLAIAVTGISSARKRQLKILSIDGKKPTPEAISEGEYPYFRPLYVVYRPGENESADRFVKWILSDRGQQVIEAEGTISLRQGSRLIRHYAYLPRGTQICNLESLRQRSMQVFANQASE